MGREAELADLVSLVDGVQLVTVTGAAGVGKTRTALEVAGALAAGFRDGAVLVSLAATVEGGVVPQILARALSVPEQPGRGLVATLADHLGRARMLIVLDNCEQVAAGVAALLEHLLRACGGVRVVATSREPLGVAGETVWTLGPLAVPDEGAQMALVEASGAVRLFCERAAATGSGFALSEANASAVAEICRRLDGVALAIELAAARVSVLSPAEIADRLGDRFGMLAGGSRTRPERHQSLRAALDWSYDLCSGQERALLRRLSVFAGGATADAAADVCGGGEAGGTVVDLLGALVAKSLVVARATGPETRYDMLETVRHYARDRLAGSGETAESQGRHACWFAALAEAAEPGLTGADQQRRLGRLAVEEDNLRAALDWALAHGEAVVALRLAGALSLWWRVRGSFRQGRAYLDAALALPGEVPAGLRAKATWGAALMAVMTADPAGAWLAEEALDLYRDLGDAAGWARSLLVAANCQVLFGAPLVAQPLLEQSVALARDAGDDWCLAHALALGALSHRNQGEPAAARALADEAVSVARRSGDAQGLRIGLILLGGIALDQGDLAAAEAAFGEALDVTGSLEEMYGTAAALLGLAEAALARGDHDRAHRLLDQAEVGARAAGNPDLIVNACHLRARLAQVAGDLDEAGRLYRETMSVAADAGADCAAALRGMGEVSWARDELDAAARLFEQALEHARAGADRREVAAALAGIADMASAGGEHERAVALHHEALDLRRRVGHTLGIIESLDALGGLAAGTVRRKGPYAARLLGAADALRQARGYAHTPAQRQRHDGDVATLRDRLGQEDLDAAWAQGADWSVDEAAAYAAKGRTSPGRPRSGWASLTTRDREVAALASAGLSNSEIAARLFVDTEAVRKRLGRIFTKLGIHSRIELARTWPSGPASPS